jgi:hypothetical protein
MGLLDFKTSLEDDISPAAKAASDALRHLQNELKTSKNTLALYQEQLAHSKELGDIEGYRKYTKLVEEARKETFALGNALVAAGPAAEHVGGALHRVVEPAEVARHALEGVSSGLKEMGSSLAQGDLRGVVEGASEALGGLASSLDLVVPGLGQVASAAIRAGGAITGFFIDIVEEGIKTALEVTDVNEKLEATFDGLGDSADAGRPTLEFLNQLSGKLPQTRGQLADWAKEFEAFGITDLSQLRGEIQATASAQALLGDSGARAYMKLSERINDAIQGQHKLKLGKDPLKLIAESGVSAQSVADRMGISLKTLDSQLRSGTADAKKFADAIEGALSARGKKALDAMGNSIEVLESKALETFQHLFYGIDTKPITDGIKDLIELGNVAEPSGKALQNGFKAGLQGIIDWVGKAITEVEVLFLEVELYAMKNRKSLSLLAEGFGIVGNSILLVANAVETLISLGSPPDWLKNLLTAPAAFGVGLGGGGGPPAPAHADGGLVGKPAPGEFFASVAPGEMILPERQTRELMGGGIGPGGREMMMSAANTNAGASGGIHIDNLELTIQAPNGVTDATSLSATGLSLALERFQLASGR